VSLGGKFFDIELWRTLSLNTYKLSHTLSLHRKEYFEYFIRQLRLFSIIYSFLTCIVLKIFCSRELLWARRLDFNVLSFLVHFERIGPRRSEKHLTGFFTLRWYPIAGKIFNQWSKSLWTRIFEFGWALSNERLSLTLANKETI
jgi:hypothetical protein